MFYLTSNTVNTLGFMDGGLLKPPPPPLFPRQTQELQKSPRQADLGLNQLFSQFANVCIQPDKGREQLSIHCEYASKANLSTKSTLIIQSWRKTRNCSECVRLLKNIRSAQNNKNTILKLPKSFQATYQNLTWLYALVLLLLLYNLFMFDRLIYAFPFAQNLLNLMEIDNLYF